MSKCGALVHDASNVHIPDGPCCRAPNHPGDCIRYSVQAALADNVCYYCRAPLGQPHVVRDGKRCPEDCLHEHPLPEVCDQTLGIYCTDCNLHLGVCWMDEHFSEALWNRAVTYAKSLPVTEDGWHDAVLCEQNRKDVCGLCGEQIKQTEQP